MDKDKVEKLYNKKVVKSGDRLEIYNYNCYLHEGTESKNSEGRRGKLELTQDEKERNKEIARRETLYNARNNIIRLISCNSDLQAFITLTYAEVPGDLKESRKHLDIFFKRLKRKYDNLKFLWVMEYGSLKGRLHYHLLTNIKINIKTSKGNELKSQEQKELEQLFHKRYWPYGWVDIRQLKEEGNTNIAKYVSCYLVEDIIGLQFNGYRVYGYSRNLSRPIISKVDTKEGIEDLTHIEGYKMQYIGTYKIQYTDKTGNNSESQVQYFDYIKE